MFVGERFRTWTPQHQQHDAQNPRRGEHLVLPLPHIQLSLEYTENGDFIGYYTHEGFPSFNNFAEAQNWLRQQEEKRLELRDIKRPNLKWRFQYFFNLDLKAVLDRQPLVGTGPLPDWLRNFAHGHLQGQPLFVALHRDAPSHKGRSLNSSGSAAGTKLLRRPHQ